MFPSLKALRRQLELAESQIASVLLAPATHKPAAKRGPTAVQPVGGALDGPNPPAPLANRKVATGMDSSASPRQHTQAGAATVRDSALCVSVHRPKKAASGPAVELKQAPRRGLAQALKLADQWRTKCASQELRIAGQMETVHALEDSSKQQAAALEAVQAELATKAEALEGARAALVHTRAALQREQQEAAGQAALVMGQAKKREAQLQAQNAFLESQLSELKQQAARGRERESSLLEAAKRAAADRAGLAGTAAAACTAATDAEHSLLQLQKRMASLQRTLHQEKKNREDLELKLAKAAAGCEKLHRDLSAARQARRMGEAERRSTAASLEACRQQAEAAQRQVADLRQQNEALKASLKQASMRQFKVTEDNSRLRQRNAHQRQRLQDLLHTRHDSGTDSEESETPDWVQLPGGGAGTDHSQLALNTYYAYSHAARPKSAPPKAAPLAGAGKQPAEKTERHKHAKERGRTAPTRSGDQRMLAMRAPRPRSKTGSGQGRS
ncbi:hypothetical protein WJX72_003042 [[Myrmecia] bisecta]|uniref:Uncharacterized protein n=1 Tax=[Myrmecia] bisecta TaxID=41462 RepID=A0AAW1QET4_9CHLO